MASSQFNIHEPKQDLTVTSVMTSFTIVASYAYRQGNHIHAEVYGSLSADITNAHETPFFTLSGIKAPTATKYVGTAIVMDGAQHPAYSIPALVQLRSNKYFYQRIATSLVSGQRLGFIVDYVDE